MNKKSTVLIVSGVVAIALALALTVYNFYSERIAEEAASAAYVQMVEHISEVEKEIASYTEYEEVEFVPDYVLNPKMEMPETVINGNRYIGTLEIPSLGLTLPVISELTDYSLRIAPSRYKGSVYTDDLIIGAHNYRSHFSNLGNLPVGSDVIFTDVDGNVFNFVSVETETLQPTAIEEMQSGEWDLTLFTCTFGGQYRITVRCEKV